MEHKYTARATAFLDFAKGGYAHMYEVFCNGETIGWYAVSRETRSNPLVTTYGMGDTEYPTLRDMKAAHEQTHHV